MHFVGLPQPILRQFGIRSQDLGTTSGVDTRHPPPRLLPLTASTAMCTLRMRLFVNNKRKQPERYAPNRGAQPGGICANVVQREPVPGGFGPGLRQGHMRFLCQLPLLFHIFSGLRPPLGPGPYTAAVYCLQPNLRPPLNASQVAKLCQSIRMRLFLGGGGGGAYTQQGRAHIRRLHPDEAASPALMRRAAHAAGARGPGWCSPGSWPHRGRPRRINPY
jgi:hypothetical protein